MVRRRCSSGGDVPHSAPFFDKPSSESFVAGGKKLGPPAFGFNMGFTARFEKTAIVFDLTSGKPLTVMHNGGGAETPEMPTKTDGYFNEIDYFLTCIEKKQKPKISTPKESRDAVAIALAEIKSAQTGKPVAIK